MLFVLIALVTLIPGCNNSTSSNSEEMTSRNVAECIEPNNPYNVVDTMLVLIGQWKMEADVMAIQIPLMRVAKNITGK